MKTILLCAALLAGGTALADELADADALFAKKAYPEALQKYTKLAKGGDPVAQQHLGAMYFYGEAGAADMDKAALWWGRAAAKGNKVAIAALDMMRQRQARRAQLDYWIAGYDGAEFAGGEYRCMAPRFPAVSKVNEEIERYSARMQAWEACHNRRVAHLNASLPLTSLIPADIAALLTKEESDRASAHLRQVGERVAEDTRVAGKLAVADFDAWRNATDAYVKEHNEIVKSAPRPGPDPGR